MNNTPKKTSAWLEAFGWYGAAAVLAAYLLVSVGSLAPDGFLFQFLNLSGGVGLTWIAWVKKDWQLVAVNGIWAVIALVALAAIFK